MSTPRIDAFLIDDSAEDEFAEHGLTEDQVRQVLESPYAIVRNKKNRAGQYLLVGRDYSSICIAIPVVRTWEAGVWRPITAWPCNEAAENVLKSRGI